MAGQIRRLDSIAIAREDDTAKGTGVLASTGHYIGFSSGILKPVDEYGKIEPAIGRIEAGIESHVVKEMTMLTFSAPVKTDWLGHILTGILGNVVSVAAGGETVVFEHTITVANDAAPPTYTLFMLDPIQDDQGTYGTVGKLVLNVEAGGILTADVEMMAQRLEAGSGTASYSTDHHFQGSHATVKLAANTAALGAAAAVPFETLQLTFERELNPVHDFGDTEPRCFVAGPLKVTGQLTKLFEDTAQRDAYVGGTDQAMLISLQDTNTTIGNAENPGLDITLDKVNFVEFDRPEGIDEPDIETIAFEAYFDLDEATPRMTEVVLTNEEIATAYTTP